VTTLTVTYRQGNILLGACNGALPEKINDELKFPWDVRATFTRNSRQLFKAIKKASPGFQARPIMIPVFGDPKNWKKDPSRAMKVSDGLGGFREIELQGNQAPQYSIIDGELTVDLELNAQASDAVGLILVQFAHPDSKNQEGKSVCLSAADQDDIVWPLAEKLFIVPWLEEKVGLTKGQEIKVQYTPPKPEAAPATASKEGDQKP